MQFLLEITKKMEPGTTTMVDIPGGTSVQLVVPKYSNIWEVVGGTLIPHLPAHTPPVLESGGRWS